MTRLLAALLLALSWPAQAQQPACDGYDNIRRTLNRDYGENVVGRGTTTGGRLVEIIASKDGETWSLVIKSPYSVNGQKATCMIGSGEDWEAIEWQAPKNPE